MALIPGEIIDGKYRIVRLLGVGGMGAVYEGENQRINRRVAIKVLHAATAAKASAVRRFEQEARAAGLIGSEHIVEVLDLGSLPSGENYMVMEFLEGETLEARIEREGRLSPHQTAPMAVQLLNGLAAAHKANIIHRDLKPDNVFLVKSLAGTRDFVKVVDFGVSKFSSLESEGMSMTSTGAVVGTPYYLSPEQARGVRQLDARSDLYSVGVVLYQAVTGQLPFHAETFNELVFKIALEAPEPAEVVVPGLDPAFAAIISKAMTREASGRFQTAEEFQEALVRWLDEHPDPNAEPARRSYISAPPGPLAPAALPAPAAAPARADSGPIQGGMRPSGGTVPLDGALARGGAPSPLPSSLVAALATTDAAVELPKKRSGSIAVIAAVIIVSAVGGALGAYKLSEGGSRSQAASQPTTVGNINTQTTTAATPLAAATEAAQPAASAQTAASAASTAGTASAPTTDASTAKAGASAPIAAAALSATKKAAAATTSAPTATAKPTGRVIGGEL